MESNVKNKLNSAPLYKMLIRKFTLLELMIVVAVIMIITGMLLPALNSARKKAADISCVSKLKQIGAGHAMYSNDFADWVLPVRQSTSDEYKTIWYNILGGTYSDNYNYGLKHFVTNQNTSDPEKINKDSFSCPREKVPFGPGTDTANITFKNTHYVQNGIATGYTGNYKSKKMSFFINPAAVIICGDNLKYNAINAIDIYTFSYRHSPSGDPRSPYNGNTSPPPNTGQVNILYSAGNVLQRSPIFLLSTTDAFAETNSGIPNRKALYCGFDSNKGSDF